MGQRCNVDLCVYPADHAQGLHLQIQVGATVGRLIQIVQVRAHALDHNANGTCVAADVDVVGAKAIYRACFDQGGRAIGGNGIDRHLQVVAIDHIASGDGSSDKVVYDCWALPPATSTCGGDTKATQDST